MKKVIVVTGTSSGFGALASRALANGIEKTILSLSEPGVFFGDEPLALHLACPMSFVRKRRQAPVRLVTTIVTIAVIKTHGFLRIPTHQDDDTEGNDTEGGSD
jgi:NAD(P)-dependent dehydrogenase (short-subunit alcohol dehydrogenase family)